MAGGRGCGEGELLCNGYQISVWENEKILEIDDADSCPDLNILIATELYVHLKMVKTIHFIMHILSKQKRLRLRFVLKYQT